MADESNEVPPAPPPNRVNLTIESVLGGKYDLIANDTATIAEVKNAMSRDYGISFDYNLILCPSTGGTDKHTQMADENSLKSYGIDGTARLMLVPTVKAGPTPMAKVLIQCPEVNVLIDRLLKEKNKSRDPRMIYYVVLGSQPGEFVLVERPDPTAVIPDVDSSQQPSQQPPPRQLTEKEKAQNKKTSDKMKRIRAMLGKKKAMQTKKEQEPSADKSSPSQL